MKEIPKIKERKQTVIVSERKNTTESNNETPLCHKFIVKHNIGKNENV